MRAQAKTVQKKPQKKLGRPFRNGVDVDMRGKIIDAAIHCFAERGFAKASNREIALEAGLTSGSLYHYFNSKAAIYREALRDVNCALLDEYRAACCAAPEATIMEQLGLGLERVIELSRQRPGLMRFAAASAGEIERNDELEWLDPQDALAFPEFFLKLLKQARSRGELARGINIKAAVKVLLACISGLAAMHGSLRNEQEFALVLRTFERLLRGEFMLNSGS